MLPREYSTSYFVFGNKISLDFLFRRYLLGFPVHLEHVISIPTLSTMNLHSAPCLASQSVSVTSTMYLLLFLVTARTFVGLIHLLIYSFKTWSTSVTSSFTFGGGVGTRLGGSTSV